MAIIAVDIHDASRKPSERNLRIASPIWIAGRSSQRPCSGLSSSSCRRPLAATLHGRGYRSLPVRYSRSGSGAVPLWSSTNVPYGSKRTSKLQGSDRRQWADMTHSLLVRYVPPCSLPHHPRYPTSDNRAAEGRAHKGLRQEGSRL